MESVRASLEDMQSIDIRTVDSATLRDIQDVAVDRNLPKEERIRSYLRQIGNPYCYRCGKYVVKIGFSNNGNSLEDCLLSYLQSKC